MVWWNGTVVGGLAKYSSGVERVREQQNEQVDLNSDSMCTHIQNVATHKIKQSAKNNNNITRFEQRPARSQLKGAKHLKRSHTARCHYRERHCARPTAPII